jgi:hypothetical protein
VPGRETAPGFSCARVRRVGAGALARAVAHRFTVQQIQPAAYAPLAAARTFSNSRRLETKGSPNGEPFSFSAQAGDAMPIDPDSPFAPADPSQGWQTRGLPRIIVHPEPPPNAPDPDGIDD